MPSTAAGLTGPRGMHATVIFYENQKPDANNYFDMHNCIASHEPFIMSYNILLKSFQ